MLNSVRGEMKMAEMKYTFPCGKTVTVDRDTGFAFGILVRQKDSDGTERWANDQCKACTEKRYIGKQRYMNTETHEQSVKEDTRCIGYSNEYLKNHKMPTLSNMTDFGIDGKYQLEITVDSEGSRAVLYVEGLSEGCSLLDLFDDYCLEDVLEKYKREDGIYDLYMTNMYNGKTMPIEFESIDEIMKLIVSVRLVSTEGAK